MYVETTRDGCAVRDAADLKSLSVRAADAGALAGLAGLGEPTDDGGHVWLDIRALRAAAGATLPAEERAAWTEGFDGMIAFAAKHGWTSDDGTRVRAHVEAPPSVG